MTTIDHQPSQLRVSMKLHHCPLRSVGGVTTLPRGAQPPSSELPSARPVGSPRGMVVYDELNDGEIDGEIAGYSCFWLVNYSL